MDLKPSLVRSVLVSSVLAAVAVVGLGRPVRAQIINLATTSSGTVYQADAGHLSPWTSKAGWKQVSFLISTSAEHVWHKATASCQTPGVGGYDVNVPDYNWGWKPGTSGYPAGTIAGDIARAICREAGQ